MSCVIGYVAHTVTLHSMHAKSTCLASVESDLAEAQLALQQMDELFSIEKQEHINPTVRIASGLGLEIGSADSITTE